MKIDFFIAEKIKFSPHENTLSIVSSDEIVELSPVASQLLEKLLTNEPHISKRDDLLESVFESNGISPSYGNLSQHVMLIRKGFAGLGHEEEVITTIPKVGFRIASDVRRIQNGVIPEKKSHATWQGKWMLLPGGIIYLVISIIFLFIHNTAGRTNPDLMIESVTRWKNCKLHFIKSSLSEKAEDVLNFLRENDMPLNCDNSNEIYIWRDRTPGVTRNFTAVCDTEHCKGIYAQHKS